MINQILGKTDHVEKFYNIEYANVRISRLQMDSWKCSSSATESPFRLPDRNIFIASHFPVYDGSTDKTNCPKLIMNNEFCRVWFFRGICYNLPKCCLYFHMQNGIVNNSSADYAAANM